MSPAILLARFDAMVISELTHEKLSNAELMRDIARLLNLPKDLLIGRAREAVLRTEIAQRDFELKQLQQQLSA